MDGLHNLAAQGKVLYLVCMLPRETSEVNWYLRRVSLTGRLQGEHVRADGEPDAVYDLPARVGHPSARL